jgi:hypothetical protein
MIPAELLALSGERDRWHALALSYFADGYRAGFEAGHDTGYSQAVTEWRITALGMTHLGGASYAELDRRRYPPGGRKSWIIPRPGEADGGDRS